MSRPSFTQARNRNSSVCLALHAEFALFEAGRSPYRFIGSGGVAVWSSDRVEVIEQAAKARVGELLQEFSIDRIAVYEVRGSNIPHQPP